MDSGHLEIVRAEDLVRQAREDLELQKRTVAELEFQRRNSLLARTLLRTYEAALQQLIEERDRLKRNQPTIREILRSMDE